MSDEIAKNEKPFVIVLPKRTVHVETSIKKEDQREFNTYVGREEKTQRTAVGSPTSFNKHRQW